MIGVIATLAGLLFGVISTMLAVHQHVKMIRKDYREQLEKEKNKHSDAQVKAYAAQRDFEHLKRNLDQHKEAIKFMQEDLTEMKENQIEMRTLLKTINHKVGDKEE